MRRPLLLLHAPGDTVVKIDNARHLFETAPHPKSFVALDGADHLLTRPADARYAANVIAAWAARYLPEPSGPALSTEVLENGTVRVSERGTGAYAVSIQAVRHTLIGDERASVGGDDAGSSPYELLLAALGGCMVMTLRMFARQKQWPLENVHGRLKHGKVHATDCADCEMKEDKVVRIERVIELVGPLNEAQRARMMEIADRPPGASDASVRSKGRYARSGMTSPSLPAYRPIDRLALVGDCHGAALAATARRIEWSAPH